MNPSERRALAIDAMHAAAELICARMGVERNLALTEVFLDTDEGSQALGILELYIGFEQNMRGEGK